MCERAAKTWEVPVEQVMYADGVVQDTVDHARYLTFMLLPLHYGRGRSQGVQVTGRTSAR
jgi:hypothetical protein